MNETTERYLLEAIELARRSRLAGDPPFGSILVDAAGNIIRRERNTVVSSRDITAHPELKLAKWAARNVEQRHRRGLAMFTSCQPCAMCTNVIARAAIGHVTYALSSQQLQSLKPVGFANPDSATVEYHGPALYAAALVPLLGYYD